MLESIFMLESEFNPEHNLGYAEKLKRELFGYQDYFFNSHDFDRYIDLSQNPTVPFDEKIPDGLALIEQYTQDGKTIHYSHMPSLLRKKFTDLNILPLFDISEIMELMTEEEITAFENSLSDLDE